MHTIKLQLEDDIYESIAQKGIDINSKVREFLYSLADDAYPAISMDEAKKRVAAAVQRYENNTGTYLNQDEYDSHISNSIKKLKAKYADN